MEALKKLRLALIGALVVILVLVGALVWSLTSDGGGLKLGLLLQVWRRPGVVVLI